MNTPSTILCLVLIPLSTFLAWFFFWKKQLTLFKAAINQGGLILHEKVAPFSWICKDNKTAPWTIEPLPKIQWERKANTAWTVMPTWKRGCVTFGILLAVSTVFIGLGILSGRIPSLVSIGWISFLIAVTLFLRSAIGAAHERIKVCHDIHFRPWLKQWSSEQSGERIPVEKMPAAIQNQVFMLARFISEPEEGNAKEHLESLQDILPPRIIGEILRAVIWRLIKSKSGNNIGRNIETALALGAPLDHDHHTRQTNINYQSLPILTSFTGQSNSETPVAFWFDHMKEVVDTLGKNEAFDINAVDQATGKTTLAELILEIDHYKNKEGRRAEQSAQDIMKGVDLLIENGARLKDAMTVMGKEGNISEERAYDLLAESHSPQIAQALAEQSFEKLNSNTAAAKLKSRKSSRL